MQKLAKVKAMLCAMGNLRKAKWKPKLLAAKEVANLGTEEAERDRENYRRRS